MQSSRPDLTTEADVARVVHTFYDGIARDPLIGRFFEGIDLPAHLPRMVAFWSSALFHTGTYRGRPFDVHLTLEGLDRIHFTGWLERFTATVDMLYQGPNAEGMKARASQVAAVFQMKLGLLDFVTPGNHPG